MSNLDFLTHPLGISLGATFLIYGALYILAHQLVGAWVHLFILAAIIEMVGGYIGHKLCPLDQWKVTFRNKDGTIVGEDNDTIR